MFRRPFRSLILGGILFLFLLPAVTHAQITLDGSLGPKGPLPGPDYAIDAKVGQLRGSNLFHSFGQFNVHTNESATFTGPSTVENVIGRVTGGQQSLIDGQIRSEMPQANMYLLNPSGVLFGPNATLDVNGSFHVSTADYLRMADGEKFSANLSQQSVLTSAPPAAFGFLSSNPAPITIQGSALQVPEGKTLSVIGGDLQIMGGSLSAPHGQLNLASVASAGEVIPTVSEQGTDLKMEGFSRLGTIEASQGAHLNTDGEGGGSVLIRGGRLVVDNATISSNTQGNVDGARVGVDAQIAEDVVITNAGRIESTVAGAGNGGSTELKVNQLTLTDGARIDTSTNGDGQGGALSVTATDSISISGRDSKGSKSGLFSNALGKGDGGKVSVSASTLTMSDRGVIDAHTAGDGNAGNVDVQVGTLTLTGGAQIQARSGVAEFKEGVLIFSGTGGPGRGGDVTVRATDAISIAGNDSDGNFSGLFSNTVNKGDGGKLSVSAPVLQDEGRINAGTFGEGNGGDIDVQVGKLTLQNGGFIFTGVGAGVPNLDGSFTFIGVDNSGRGGNLTIHATESILISGQSSQGVSSGLFTFALKGSGDGGQIFVSAPILELHDGGQIASNNSLQSTGNAGGIKLEVGRLTADNGFILANTVAEGNGGDIDVQVRQLTLQNGGTIFSGVGSAVPDGVGGFIFIGVDDSGQGGKLTVKATEAILISGQNSLGQPSGLFTEVLKGSGDAGKMFVSAPELLITDGGGLAAPTLSDGNAGDIEVRVGTLTFSSGGFIFTAAGAFVPPGNLIGGSGHAGNITVIATDSISIAGYSREGFKGGLFTDALKGNGNGGQIFISAPILDMADGGEISSSTFSESTGNAGDIRLEVGRLTISGDADIATITDSPGQGGDIQVQARQIELNNNKAALTASSSGSGDAGNIELHAEDTFRSRNSVVSTESIQSGGGKIDLSAGQIVELVESQITTTVQGGIGDAGNITIDPRYVVLNDSQVIARAVEGNGGNIFIDADVFLASPASVVDASSQKGISGTIDIRGAVSNLSGLITPLPQGYLSTAALVEDRCAGRLREGQISSFVVTGRDGMPLQPGGVLPSPLYETGQMGARSRSGSNESHGASFDFAATRLRSGRTGLKEWQVPRITAISLDMGCGR
jgi:filamentous hemagglutinin family protein